MSGDRPVQWHGTQPHADRGELLAALDEARAQLRVLADCVVDNCERPEGGAWYPNDSEAVALAKRILEADDGT